MIQNTLLDQKKVRDFLDSLALIEELSDIRKYKIKLSAHSKNIVFVDRFVTASNYPVHSNEIYFLKLHYLEGEYILSKFSEKRKYKVILRTEIEDVFVKYLKEELSG